MGEVAVMALLSATEATARYGSPRYPSTVLSSTSTVTTAARAVASRSATTSCAWADGSTRQAARYLPERHRCSSEPPAPQPRRGNVDRNFLAALPHRHLMRSPGSGLPGIAWLKHVSLLPEAPASTIDRQLERTELHEGRRFYGGSRSMISRTQANSSSSGSTSSNGPL